MFQNRIRHISRALPSAILILIAGLFLFLLGTIGSEYFTKRISLIIVIYGLVSFLEGREIAKILRFPILILFFAVPLPYILYNAVAFPLKLLATKLAVNLLSFVGVAVFREGNIVNLSHTKADKGLFVRGVRHNGLRTEILYTLNDFPFGIDGNNIVPLFEKCLDKVKAKPPKSKHSETLHSVLLSTIH